MLTLPGRGRQELRQGDQRRGQSQDRHCQGPAAQISPIARVQLRNGFRVQADVAAGHLLGRAFQVAGEGRQLAQATQSVLDALAQARLRPAVLAHPGVDQRLRQGPDVERGVEPPADARSEEHTSELQSLMRISYAVFCWKKKNNDSYYTLSQ